MFKNYLKIAIRNIIKYKGYSFINITGLGIGLACSIFILLWVYDELSYDMFHENVENIYRVEQDQFYGGEAYHVNVTPYVVAPAFEEELPEVLESCRFTGLGSLMVQYKEKQILQEDIVVADPSLFTMFTFPMLISGSKDILTDPHSIVITERTAEKYFGDEDPIGKRMTLNKEFDFSVAGICENPPHNSSLKFEIVVPFEFLKEVGRWNESWQSNSIISFLEAQPGTPAETITKKLRDIYKEKVPDSDTKYIAAPFAGIHLFSYFGYGKPQSDIQYVYMFGINRGICSFNCLHKFYESFNGKIS